MRYSDHPWGSKFIGLDDQDASFQIWASATKWSGDLEPWEFDVTNLVKNWLENPQSNNGILLCQKDDVENVRLFDFPVFYSAEFIKYPSKRPKLVIDYR